MLKACNFAKGETPAQLFSCEFCKIFQNTYVVEHLQTPTSEHANSLQTFLGLFLVLVNTLQEYLGTCEKVMLYQEIGGNTSNFSIPLYLYHCKQMQSSRMIKSLFGGYSVLIQYWCLQLISNSSCIICIYIISCIYQ